MSEPFLAEIKMVGFNFAPRGWAFCDGQILPINQNQSLYSLLGTTYGGDGRTSFALPDLRSRAPIHKADGYRLGQKGGAETVALTAAEIAAHTHTLRGTDAVGNLSSPVGNLLAQSAGVSELVYGPLDAANAVNLSSAAITNAGGGQGHSNEQPTTVLSFCIALRGLYPSRN